MKTIKLLFFFLFLSTTLSFSQVVNKVSISKETDVLELYCFKKPFSQKESFFIDFGQDKFRPHYYDHKTQAVFDDSARKFKKGEYLKLYKYLKSKSWIKIDERDHEIGDVKGRVITFEKKN